MSVSAITIEEIQKLFHQQHTKAECTLDIPIFSQLSGEVVHFKGTKPQQKYSYVATFCPLSADKSCAKTGGFFCQYDNTDDGKFIVSIASWQNAPKPLLEYSFTNEEIIVQFENGDLCGRSYNWEPRTLELHIHCPNKSTTSSNTVVQVSQCSYRADMYSSIACN